MLSNQWRGIVVAFSVAFIYEIPATKANAVKTWIPNTNFLNPRNWEHDQLPCANDKVIFPDSAPIITFMPEKFAASELVLPVDGELIFPEDSVFELTGGARPGACTGKDVRFKTTIDFWSEPTNWNISSDYAFPRISNRRNAAVPHAFQVPCRTDTVLFPRGTTFQVHINLADVKIAFLKINGVRYQQTDFNDLVRSRVGSLLFPNEPKVRISSMFCADTTGCMCGNDKPDVLYTICQFVTPHCPVPECSDPIKPVGSCCPICGAKIRLTFELDFDLHRFMDVYDHILSEQEYEQVESFTSKTMDGAIQSVFVDGGKEKGQAGKAAETIYAAILSDIEGARRYHVRSAKIHVSRKWAASADRFTSSGGMSSGGLATLIIFLLFLGLGAAFYVYRRRQVSGFNFARFDLRGDKIELELGTTPHDELQPVDTPAPSSSREEEKTKSFDNPVYGTTVEEVSPAIREEPADVKDYVENPMFTFFEDTSKPIEEEK